MGGGITGRGGPSSLKSKDGRKLKNPKVCRDDDMTEAQLPLTAAWKVLPERGLECGTGLA